MLVTTAVLVVAGVAVTTGLTLANNGPAVEAGSDDTYASAPGCDTVPADAVESTVPSATLDAHERGPLPAADGATCVWTSVDTADEAPRMLHVDFTATFESDDDSGAALATERVEQLRSTDSADAASVPVLGENSLIRPVSTSDTAAEVAFARDNLVVRVMYGGEADATGEELSFDDASDGAISVAEHLASGL